MSGVLANALDRSVGATEKVTNGDFASGDLSGFTLQSTGTGTATYSAGGMQLIGTNSANRGRAYQALDLNPGKTYWFGWDGSTASGAATIGIGTTTIGNVAGVAAAFVGTGGYMTFECPDQPVYLLLFTGSGGGDVTVDNLSIREVVSL